VSTYAELPSRYPLERTFEEDVGSWWVLHVKPNCEQLVATYLLKREISYYLPFYIRKERVGYYKRIKTSRVPLFRGYICFALSEKKHSLLYDSKKLVRIIKVKEQEQFVRELGAVDTAVRTVGDLTPTLGLVPGKKVLIMNGPLRGTEGVIVKYRKESHFAVSVTLFNQSVLVRLDPYTKLELL